MERLGLEHRRLASGAASGAGKLGLIDAVASWCECLQGRQPLMTVLEELAEGLEAQAVCLSRLSRGPGGSARAVIFNAAQGSARGEKVTRSYAACVLGRYVDRPRTASVWFSSLAEDGADPALTVFQKRARIVETVVVTLTVDSRWTDFLEIHFGARLGSGTIEVLNRVAGTLSRTWANRSPGLFSDAVLASQAESKPGFLEPLLSVSNPARLSRAEFRVCLLLSRGLNASALCGELSISPSTLKAHLRSVFAKTGTTSLAELLFQLLSPLRAEPRHAEMPIARRA